MKVAIVLGTRPEIIKFAPVIRELEKLDENFFIIHTGQHYSYNMDKIFFEQLQLPLPKYHLNTGSGTHAEETGKALIGIEKVLQKESPDAVLVLGDTNSTLAGALAAAKLLLNVGHIEAGLRSFDKTMPEEINRIIADHVSHYLFAPTEIAKENLIREGISEEKIYVTGNTVVDAVFQNLELAKNHPILEELNLTPNEYFLITLHRQENTDNPTRLKNIIKALELLADHYKIPIIYPIHPRTRKRLQDNNITIRSPLVKLIEPLDYLSFLKLESSAKLILTDSGGLQEESCILKVPCVTLRDNTERPETLKVGSNILAGTQPESILEKVEVMLNRQRNWENPFGDGKAGERIVEVLINESAHF